MATPETAYVPLWSTFQAEKSNPSSTWYQACQLSRTKTFGKGIYTISDINYNQPTSAAYYIESLPSRIPPDSCLYRLNENESSSSKK